MPLRTVSPVTATDAAVAEVVVVDVVGAAGVVLLWHADRAKARTVIPSR
jgi:hypothetical protein